MNHRMVGQTLVLDPHKDLSERYNCPSCSKSFVRKAHMLRHQQQRKLMPLCAVLADQVQMVPRSHSTAISAPNRSSEGKSIGSAAPGVRLICTEATYFGLINSAVKKEAIYLSPTDKVRAASEAHVCLASNCERDAIKRLPVLDAKSWVKIVSEVCPRRYDNFILLTVVANTSLSNGTERDTSIARPRSRDGIPISHLLNSPPDEFAGRFPIRDGPHYPADEDGDSALIDADSPSEASHWSEEIEPYDPYVGATDTAFDGFFDGLESLTFGHPAIRADGLHVGSGMPMMTTNTISQALEPRAQEVRQVLSTTAGNFGSTLPEAQEMLQLGPTIEQITGVEVDHLVQLYFENYHRHCPVLHRPSFQPTLCPMALLLSVMALGGMYADEPVQIQRMRSLLDIIEAYIFSLPGLRDEYTNSLSLAEAPDEDTLQYQFEVFQGAYLIIIAQYFSGNAAAKRRARRQRYTRVLDVGMDLVDTWTKLTSSDCTVF